MIGSMMNKKYINQNGRKNGILDKKFDFQKFKSRKYKQNP